MVGRPVHSILPVIIEVVLCDSLDTPPKPDLVESPFADPVAVPLLKLNKDALEANALPPLDGGVESERTVTPRRVGAHTEIGADLFNLIADVWIRAHHRRQACGAACVTLEAATRCSDLARRLRLPQLPPTVTSEKLCCELPRSELAEEYE
eukprot:6965030-Prymnesium_polylepis.2